MKEMKSLKWETVFTEILIILLGFILLFNPAATARTICYIIGMIIMAVGIIKIISYFLMSVENSFQKNSFVSGAILIIIGILFMVKVNIVISIIPYFMAIIVIISGLSKLQGVFDIIRVKRNGWFIPLVMALINIALGIFLLCNLIGAAKLMLRVVGACMIYSGVTGLINVIYISKKMRDYIQDMKALEQDGKD